MPATRTKRGIAILVLAVAALILPSVVASAHGYTTSPMSRQKQCQNGSQTNCGAIQWEPQSVEGPKGFPAAGPADGRICSAGLSQFAELDNPNRNWGRTEVRNGAAFTFNWTFTAAHATTSFRYFVTRNGWNQGAPLTRAALESTPFSTLNYNSQRPPFTFSHGGTLPSGKSGRHIILAVWDIADTGNAFYACSDVNFS